MVTLVDLSVEEKVALLVLNDPGSRNALTGSEMLDSITEAVRSAEGEAQAMVVTGAGSAFSAGGNIKDMASASGLFGGTPEAILEGYRSSIQRLTRTMAGTDLVTVAAVNGPAVGAGFDLALGCDLRVGSPSARFSHSFVDLGIIPGDGGLWLLAHQLGWQRAAEISFTGRVIGAEEAVELGILLEVTDEVVARARALATEIARKPAHSIRLTKRLMRQTRTMDLDGFLEYSAALQAVSHHTDAHRQAVQDYLERLQTRS
ncbi:MAG: enoyl-CoA hydratase/isomerase family protein [Acidimicrobiia bacterium]|nr:enoyl-CoA hydratase/isomerase family protein [Acidimicrobiia bacterium]